MFFIQVVVALTTACSTTFDVSEASLNSMELYNNVTRDDVVGTYSQYTGNGYVWFQSSYDYALWEINSLEAGQTALSFRYLLKSNARSTNELRVYVNDNIVESAYEFKYYGTWEWRQSDNLVVTLVEGINEIKLKGFSSSNTIAIDSLNVSMCAEAEPNNYLPNSELNE